MREIDLRDSSREATKAFIEELKEAGDHTSGDNLIDEYTKRVMDSVIRRVKRTLLNNSPFVLYFMYHPEGEILLKGFMHDVILHVSKNYPTYICRRIIYNSGLRWDHKNRLLIKGHGYWAGSTGIQIYPPTPPRAFQSEYNSSPRRGEGSKTLRKWRIDIGASTFYFKRMPNRWLPMFSEALEEIGS